LRRQPCLVGVPQDRGDGLQRGSRGQEGLAERDGVILHRFIRTDPKTGLVLTCEIKEYTRFPVVEWGLRFRNASRAVSNLCPTTPPRPAQVVVL